MTRYEADRVTAHSAALRASIKIDEDESILGEGSALTNAMRHLSHYQYRHLHVQRSWALTFGADRQVLTRSWTSTRGARKRTTLLIRREAGTALSTDRAPEFLTERIAQSFLAIALDTLSLPAPSCTAHPDEPNRHRVLPGQINFASKHRNSVFIIKARIYV